MSPRRQNPLHQATGDGFVGINMDIRIRLDRARQGKRTRKRIPGPGAVQAERSGWAHTWNQYPLLRCLAEEASLYFSSHPHNSHKVLNWLITVQVLFGVKKTGA